MDIEAVVLGVNLRELECCSKTKLLQRNQLSIVPRHRSSLHASIQRRFRFFLPLKFEALHYVKKFRAEGIKGFYARPGRRGPGVLTPEVLQRVQSSLDEGQGISEIAVAFKLKADTLNKAVRSGRLKVPVKKSPGGGRCQQQE